MSLCPKINIKPREPWPQPKPKPKPRAKQRNLSQVPTWISESREFSSSVMEDMLQNLYSDTDSLTRGERKSLVHLECLWSTKFNAEAHRPEPNPRPLTPPPLKTSRGSSDNQPLLLYTTQMTVMGMHLQEDNIRNHGYQVAFIDAIWGADCSPETAPCTPVVQRPDGYPDAARKPQGMNGIFPQASNQLHSMDGKGGGGDGRQVPRIRVAEFDDDAGGGPFGGSNGSDDAHARLMS
ncbi:hypothetical protein KR032_004803 [Drosophila birchii]|nr:hypothetical protein KR032_004803 [Drosophila birchii]